MNAATDTNTEFDTEFAAIVAELTRRGFLGGALGGAALLGLAACGSSGPARHPATGGSGTRRKVPSVYGDITVPGEPKRVIATDFPEACALFDLGIVPVGRPSYLPNFAAYNTLAKDIPTIDDAQTGDLTIEKIAALTPDLIVGDDWADPNQQRVPYDKLSVIAPTALFAWEQAAGNWPDLAAETAAAMNKTAAMNALEHHYQSKAAKIATTYEQLFARTRWDLIDCSKDVWDLYSAASSHGGVLTGAGVPLGAGSRQQAGYRQYSFERFGLLADTDVIVTTPASLPYLDKQATFTQLPAVRAGRVYPSELFFPASYGIATALLDELAGICAKVKEATG